LLPAVAVFLVTAVAVFLVPAVAVFLVTVFFMVISPIIKGLHGFCFALALWVVELQGFYPRLIQYYLALIMIFGG